MKKYFYLLAVLAIGIILVQCKSEKKEQVKEIDDTETFGDEGFGDEGFGNDVFYAIPSPTEILSEIFFEDIDIDPTLVNSYENAKNYVDVRNQTVNLGVYIADFAYLSYDADGTTELEYMKVIKELAEKSNIYGLMNKNTVERVQENLMNKDSIAQISQELFYEISGDLENSNRQNIFVLMSSGAIIESLYLSVSLVDDFGEYQEIIERMYEQKYVFENFYNFALNYSDDNYVKMILDQLEVLNETFEELSKDNEKANVVKSKPGEIKVEGGSRFVVNEDNFNKFKTNIVEIRNEIIKSTN